MLGAPDRHARTGCDSGRQRRAAAVLVAASVAALGGRTQAAVSVAERMPPLAQFTIANEADEIALARSAAPPSLSADAEVLALGPHGYRTAVKGKNGFVCIVERAWANEFDSPEFWNAKIRAPICFNAPAARSVLADYVQRTTWLLSGATRSEAEARTRAAVGAGQIRAPEPGAMCYMMSKRGYLADDVHGPWRPHLMFFVPRMKPEAWGANGPDGVIFAATGKVEPRTVFMVPIAKWSDGTPAAMKM